MNNYGKKISEYRKKQKLSQTELAMLVGVSQEDIFNWENGLDNPKEEELTRLARALNINASKIIDKKNLIQTELEYFDPEKIFKDYLEDYEKILWSARPKSLMQTKKVIVFVAFFIAFFVIISAVLNNNSNPSSAFASSIMFMPITFFIIIFVFSFLATKQRPYYAITDKRVLILRSQGVNSFLEIRPSNINDIKVMRGVRGTKTIFIQNSKHNYPLSFSTLQILYNISDHEKALELLNDLKNKKLG